MTAAEEKAKESFSSGMVSLLEPVVKEMDVRSQKIIESQELLAKKIDAFSAELEKLSGLEAVPHLAPYADKLNGSRKKLKKVDMLVQNTQERVANIQRMHLQLQAFEKSQKERLEGKPAAGRGSEDTAPSGAGESESNEREAKGDSAPKDK